MKKLYLTFLLMCAVNLFSKNVIIDNTPDVNEPSIKVDPLNPARMVAGANINRAYISNDTGHTWSKLKLFSPYGVWGDPCIDVDTAGNFYFFHLSYPPPAEGSWIDRIICQKLTPDTNYFEYASYTFLNPQKKAQDKEWSAIDRKTNTIYVTWTQFDNYGSTLPQDSSIILFAKSTDEGKTWSKAKRINAVAGDCIDSDNTAEGAMPAVGANGEVYVAWMGPLGLVFNKSEDAGETWLPKEQILQDLPEGWDFSIPGIERTNGFPIIKCDLSKGKNHGTIYINWSDQRNGIYNTDIWLIKSTDGGKTWSERIRVNNDTTTKHQFFTWMDIDQTTGYLYVVFYDRRNYNNNATDVYLAVSKDGGNTFENIRISESPFVPSSNIFFGDYTNISVHNGVIRPIWVRMDTYKLSLLTDTDPLSKSSIVESGQSNTSTNISASQYPNPAENLIYTSFKLRSPAKVSIGLYNLSGKLIHKIMESKDYEAGAYIEPFNLKELNLSAGIYYTKININGNIKTLRTIIID